MNIQNNFLRVVIKQESNLKVTKLEPPVDQTRFQLHDPSLFSSRGF